MVGILTEQGCVAGLTTEVGVADLDRDRPLTLLRLDTNDLPKDGRARPNRWTRMVMEVGGRSQ